MSTHRTPKQVFDHHARVLADGDIWGIVGDYADDALYIDPDGVARGRDGIRRAFVKLLGDLPDAQWEFETTLADDIVLLRWSAESAHTRVDDGVDTFVVNDGLIRAQTVSYTLQSKLRSHDPEGAQT
jgi:hypothetical protein